MAEHLRCADAEGWRQSRGKCKTPKRLRETLALLDKMLWRHGKCAYKALRDKACPSKVWVLSHIFEFESPFTLPIRQIKPDGAEVLDTSIILVRLDRPVCVAARSDGDYLLVTGNDVRAVNMPPNPSSASRHERVCGHVRLARVAPRPFSG